MGEQLALVPGEDAEERELVRGQLDGSPSRRRSASRVDRRSPISSTGSVGPARAQGGAQPREQLVDAEWLRHVVVGACVERRDLLLLLADDGEDQHRRVGSGRSSRQTSTPLLPGRTRSRMTASGGLTAARVSASSPRRRRLDLVARSAQGLLERPQDLRLVVDYEDARRSCRAPLRWPRRREREASAGAPCLGSPSARRRSPRRIRARSQGRALFPTRRAALRERLEDSLELALRRGPARGRRRSP